MVVSLTLFFFFSHHVIRLDSSSNNRTQGGESETKDFKKVSKAGTDIETVRRVRFICPNSSLLVCQLFEELSRENSLLQSQLQETQRSVTQTRLDLEKATQVTTKTHNKLNRNRICHRSPHRQSKYVKAVELVGQVLC